MYQFNFQTRRKLSDCLAQMLEFIAFNSINIKYIIKVLMIQKEKDTGRNQELFIIEHICQQSLAFFVDKVPLSRSNFPLLELTYTVWRSYAFEKMKKNLSQYNINLDKEGIRLFFQISQKKYLVKYIARIQAQMNLYCRGLQNVQLQLKEKQEKLPKQEEEIYQVIVQLGKSVWSQQLYLQLIEDLIRIPYLNIFPDSVTLTPKLQFATDYIFRKKKESKYAQIANNTGKNIFNKIIKGLTTAVFSKTFVLKINTLFGTFNPIVMGASFGLSQYMQHLDKKSKELALQAQIKTALDLSNKKVETLRNIYQSCLQNIQFLIEISEHEPEREQYQKKIKDIFLSVFEQEWLHIQVTEAEDGWPVVKLEQKESFQDLTQ